MDVNQLIDALIEREGGYVANPADKGGPTRFGITEATARANGYAGDMARLLREIVAAIYAHIYCRRPGLDRVAALAPDLAAELFDTGINMGSETATGFLRRALNALNRGASDYPDIAPAGAVDAAPIGALAAFLKTRRAAGERVLEDSRCAPERALRRPRQGAAGDEAFLYGWLANRVG
jgi:lysozyme family protein